MTQFGSLGDFVKGEIKIIADDARNYAFSNVFDVAARSSAYEKVVVGKNRRYVIEALRADGTSPWFAASHDEFALIMDGVVEIDLIRLADAASAVPPTSEGSVVLGETTTGRKMGLMRLGRGHQALLPHRAAYRFRSLVAGVILLQTMLGPHSVQKWTKICAT